MSLALMSNMKLSIIIPVYNASGVIERTLLSIKNTISHSFEVIIVNDASTDNTLNILNTLKDKFNFLNIFSLSVNSGPGVARDKGLEEACGDYVLFFDSDDLMLTEAVDDAIITLDEKGLDVALLPYSVDMGLGKKQGMWDRDERLFKEARVNSGHIIKIDNHPLLLTTTNYPWNKICRAKYLSSIKLSFGSLRLHEDILPHWNILMNTQEIYLSTKKICEYYIPESGKNVSNDKTSIRIQSVDACKSLLDVIASKKEYKKFSPIGWIFSAHVLTWARDMINQDSKAKLIKLSAEFFNECDIKDIVRIRHLDEDAFNSIYEFLIPGK